MRKQLLHHNNKERTHMKKLELQHINFDTRETYYGKINVPKLTREFFDKGYNIPLWGTDKQFEQSGLQIKDNEQAVKLVFVSEKEETLHYPVYNFSQTEESKKVYWTD